MNQTKQFILLKAALRLIYLLWPVSVTAQNTTGAGATTSVQKGWMPLLDIDLSHWEKFMGIPHSTVKGLPEGTFRSDNVFMGTPLGLENDSKNVISMIEEDGRPVLAITGETYGCVSTKERFGDYHLWLQSEGAEIYYRDFQIRNITKFPNYLRSATSSKQMILKGKRQLR